MGRSLSAAERDESKDGGSCKEFFDMVDELKTVGESLLKSMAEHVSEVELPEEGARTVNGAAGNGLRGLKARESEVSTSVDFEPGRFNSTWGERDGSREVRLKEERLDEQLKSVTDHIEVLEARLKEVEGLRKNLREKLQEVESKERDVDLMRELLSRKSKEIELREFEKLCKVEKKEKEIEFMLESLSGKFEEVEKREKDIDLMQGSLGGKLKEVEKREKELEFMREQLSGRLHEVEKREKETEFMRESLCEKLKEVEKREKDVCVLRGKLKEVEKRERQVEDMRESSEREVDALREKLKRAMKNEKELKFLQQKLWDLEKREREVKDIRGLLDRRSREVERREREVESLQEKLSRVEKRESEFEDKHRLLDRRLRETERREKNNEIFDEKLKNVEERERKVEVIHGLIDGRLKEVERREIEVELLHDKLKNVEERAKEVDLAHGSLEGRLKEVENLEKEAKILFEKSKDIEKLEKVVETMHASLERKLREADERESEFMLSQNARMKELISKEQALNTKRDTIAKEVEAANDKLKLGSHLIEKLDNALVALDRMKSTVNERFKEMQSWEATTYKSLSLILDEAVSAREIAEKRIVELENREREIISSKEKTKEDMLRHFLASYKLKYDTVCPSRNAELSMEHIDLHQCERKHEQGMVAEDAHLKLNSAERIEVKNQEHETEEHMELTGDEIRKVLLLSPDAATLVLEAMQEFYSSHLVKGDVELKLWRKYLLLLDQLQKMSPCIKPSVREAAMQLAVEWKPKAITCAYSESMVLGFLVFVAVYNLMLCLTVEELLTLLKKVAHWKETPKLLHKLCSSETISGFIQNLLNEKQYLLASAFIHECKFQHMFPQPAVLNFFLNHSKMLAKEIRRGGNNSSQAQVEALNLEISHLKDAIEHIKKFGLEFKLSPQGLEVQIKKLERTKLALTKHLMRSISLGGGQVSLAAPKNTPISSAAEVSSSSLASDARYSQNGNSRKRLATTDSTSTCDRWFLGMNSNAVFHGYYNNNNNAQYNRAHKKWRTANHVPRPGIPQEQQGMPGNWYQNL